MSRNRTRSMDTEWSGEDFLLETTALMDSTLGYASSASQRKMLMVSLGAAESGSCVSCALWLSMILPPSLSRLTLMSLRKAVREHESPLHRRLVHTSVGHRSSASRCSLPLTMPMGSACA